MKKVKSPLLPVAGISKTLVSRGRFRRELLAGLTRLPTGSATKRNDLAPELRLEPIAISDLKPASRRVRKEDPIQLAKVIQSISEFGYCRPVLITADREIIDGHTVVSAAKQVGLEIVQCMIARHLSGIDVRRLRIALNRLGETGSWNEDVLFSEIRRLSNELSVPLFIPGIDHEEVDLILREEVSASLKLDAVPKLADIPVSREGDIWRLGGHRVGCGDARNTGFLNEVLAGPLANLALTDPPYGVAINGHVTSGPHREFVMGAAEMNREEFAAFLETSLKAIYACLVEGGICMPFIDWRGIDAIIQASRKAGFSQLNLIVWSKSNAGMGSLYRSQHELLPVFKKGSTPHTNNVQLGRKGRHRTNVWVYPGASSFGSESRKELANHPTVKPVALLEDAILDVTKRGDVILDPFAGSGSTLIAAEKTGRIFRGVELDPLYVDLILRRWIAAFGQEPLHEGSQKSFKQLAMERKKAC